MTTYRLLDGTSGRPGTGSSVTTPPGVTSYSGPFQAGLIFQVTSSGMWLAGYQFYCPSGGDTGAQKFCLFAVNGASTGTVLISAGTVTSGTLTAGAMNEVTLTAPVPLAVGTPYIVATGWQAVHGFPDSNNQFGSGDPYVAGITNGPVYAFSAGDSAPNGYAPYNFPQGLFGTGTTGGTPDPAQNPPLSGSNDALFWIGPVVSDTVPSGYAGSYRLWPNKYDANADVAGDLNVNYTVATEVRLSGACTLDNAWYFSPAAATTLATRCDVWDASTGLSVASITSPSWKKPDGSAASAGVTGPMGQWVKAAFAGGTTLPAGDYRVSVFNSAGTTDANWSAKDASTDFWAQSVSKGWGASGVLLAAGAGGITSGPLSAPDYAGAAAGFTYDSGAPSATPPYSAGAVSHAQSPFGQNPGGTVQFPQLFAEVGGSLNQTQNYWVDLEVTPVPPGATGVTATVTLAAPAGTVSASSLITGHAGSLDLRAPAGAVTADYALAGVAAGLSLAAPAGSVAAGTVTAGVPAPLALAAAAGLVSASPAVAGVTAALTLAAPAGIVPGSQSVAGQPAALTLTAPGGSVFSSTAIRKAASTATVTDPRDGSPSVTPAATSASTVS